jgi:integrase
MRTLGYTQHSLTRFHSGWNKLSRYAAEKGNPPYTPVLGLEFLRVTVDYPKYFTYRDSQKRSLTVRGVRLLNEYQEYGSIAGRLPISVTHWPPEISTLRETYRAHCYGTGYSESTVRGNFNAIDPLLREVVMGQRVPLDQFTPQTLSRYVATLSGYATSTIGTWLGALRHFFRFLHGNGYAPTDLSENFPKVKSAKPERIPGILTTEEVQRLLAAVDRGNPLGKRDYAAIVTALLLGLRDSDITGLTFANIDWEKQSISLVQQKTQEPLYLPLLPAVGEAIIDYLKFGRPTTECKYVFVRHCAPYGAMESLYSVMAKHMSRAGIKSPHLPTRGMHILRHTLASGLIAQGEIYETVSAALGHKNTVSTDVYAHIDVDGLLKCALDPEEVGFFEL